MKSTLPITIFCIMLGNSCAVVTAPVKIATKTATTTIGVAGKATSAGVRAMSRSHQAEEPSIPPHHNTSPAPYSQYQYQYQDENPGY